MTENMPHGGARLTAREKAWVDYGPLGAFFIAYFLGGKLVPLIGNIVGKEWCLKQGAEMFLALAVFLPAFAVGFAYSVWKEKRVAPMLLVSGLVIGVLGGLTLLLQNKTFFYMKPTVVYLLFGGLLFAGLATGRNFLKMIFDGALDLPAAVWRRFTRNYAVFFFILALLNEIAWRYLTRDCALDLTDSVGSTHWLLGACDGARRVTCAGEQVWVNVKVFGFTLLNILFIAAQMPMILKAQSGEDQSDVDQASKSDE